MVKFLNSFVQAALVAGLMTGCTAEALQPADTREAVSFSTLRTKAAGEVNDDAALQSTGFGVFAAYTGMTRYSASTVKMDFMYNDHLTWDSGLDKWTYTPLRYWPNGEGEEAGITGNVPHYVSFFGYAPWSDGDDSDPENNPAGYCITAFSDARALGDPWLMYRLIPQEQLSHQVDLLYADGSGDQLMDQTKRAYDPGTGKVGTVDMSFKHALGCIGEKVTITLSKKASDSDPDEAQDALERLENVELRLNEVKIVYRLTPKARLILWNNGKPNWEPVLSQVMLERRTVTLLDEADTPFTLFARENAVNTTVETWESTEDNGIFFIPVEVDGYPQTATVSIRYEIYVNGILDTGMSKTKTLSIPLSDYYVSFQEGGQRVGELNITLTLDE